MYPVDRVMASFRRTHHYQLGAGNQVHGPRWFEAAHGWLRRNGAVIHSLKTPYQDGTTQLTFDPVDFIGKLATLVPKP